MIACKWCGEDFEPVGKEAKCPTCRAHKLYADGSLHVPKRRYQRMGRPSPEYMRSHAARP